MTIPATPAMSVDDAPTSALCSDSACGSDSNRRALGIVVVLGLVGVALAGRLVQLQFVSSEPYARQANRQRSYFETIPARPGDIVDRQGRLLATTIQANSLYVDPSRIDDVEHVASQLSKTLQLDRDRLIQRISERRGKQFLWIQRRLSDEQSESVRQLDLPKGSWGFREEYLRRYPQGQLAAHVIGLRNIDGVGQGGLEQALDPLLKGEDGQRVLVRDAHGRVIDALDEIAVPPRHGRTAVLTIDSIIQLYAERELDDVMEKWKPKNACVLVIEPTSCEVLAMASRPVFDPNHPNDVPQEAWKNTAIATMFEPGSTFKPFVVAWAIENGVIARDDRLHCENGVYRMKGRVLHDHHPYGMLSIREVLAKSSNIGMAKIGEKLTNERIYQSVIAFGFGRPTGCELPGELPGLVRPLSAWNHYSTGSVPMGQELAVTPLQLLTAHAALANGGLLRNPRLVLETVAPPPFGSRLDEADSAGSKIVARTVSEETANWIVQDPMVAVVRSGTGKKARLSGYKVFGKSGTAQKTDPSTGRYSSTRHVCSFVCGAPAHDPQALVLVVVDEPSVGNSHGGGSVAAPAASEILRKTLQHLRVPTGKAPLRAAGQSPAMR